MSTNKNKLNKLFKKIKAATKSNSLKDVTPKLFTYLFFFIFKYRQETEIEALLGDLNKASEDSEKTTKLVI